MRDLSYEPLDPTSFLWRSERVFGDRLAVVDGERRFAYAELADRVRRLAGALRAEGVEVGDRLAVLAPNTRVLLEATFGIPAAGGVLVAMNTRLAPKELAYILDHAGARLLLVDEALSDAAEQAATEAGSDVRLIQAGGAGDEYESMLEDADPSTFTVEDERTLFSLNYTSGTTGRPKGVMYHRRGAYLQAVAMAHHMGLGPDTVSLWTLPMFHCNGWCFPWAVTAAGGTHVCLRAIDPPEVWRLIREEGVTHFNAAPTVLTELAHDPAAEGEAPPDPIAVGTGGAPPSPALLKRMAELHMDVTHLYGLTETFGPAVICEWRPEWAELPIDEQADIKARQGVGNVISGRLRVVDDVGSDVPADGETMGEIALRGNNVMLGYYRDEEATANAAPNGWFRTGDLGVMHPDGYVELRDRAKDVIISGGENISSIEVENVIARHPAVLEAAVVAMPHDRWGEAPAAFVALKEGTDATAEEIIDHVRGEVAHFKAPKRVVFGPLPKTSTGKIQKYRLREDLWAGEEKRIR